MFYLSKDCKKMFYFLSVVFCIASQTHLLYLAMDNSLQDCSELPSGDVSDTEIVQDYKKLSKRNQANTKVNRSH